MYSAYFKQQQQKKEIIIAQSSEIESWPAANTKLQKNVVCYSWWPKENRPNVRNCKNFHLKTIFIYAGQYRVSLPVQPGYIA